MDLVRVGVVGLGMMGRNHVRVLRDLEGVALSGVHDALGDPYGVARDLPVCGSLDELLDLGLDAVIVATPTDDHESVAVRLAAAGISALIEKPLATDVAAGHRIVEAFAGRGLIAAVGHVERCNAAVRSMKERLRAGELGEIYQIATSRQGPFPDRIRDVGVIKDLATHDVDLTAWIAGHDYRDVAARTAHRAGRPHEDLVAVVASLTDGTVVNHLVNWLMPTKQRQVVVVGSRGCFVADTLSADLTFFANASVPTEWHAVSSFRGVSEGDMIRFAFPKPEPLRVELAGFRDAVAGRGDSIVTLAEGLRTLTVADAIVASSETGTVVQLRVEVA